MKSYNDMEYYKSLEKKFSPFRCVLLGLSIVMTGELSDYRGNRNSLLIIIGLVAVYLISVTIAAYSRKKKLAPLLKATKYLDILALTGLICTRGGLRSDLFVIYLIIILYNGAKYDFIGTIQSAVLSVISYGIAVLAFTPPDYFSLNRLIIRVIYILIGTYVMYEVTRMMSSSSLKEREAREQAYKDPLTKLPNRLLLSRSFEGFKIRYEKDKIPFCIAMFDLDDFKIINDTKGHVIGDYILNIVANTIKDNISGDDFLCRFGGEEFVILFSNRDISSARIAAERIRVGVAAIRILYDIGNVTISAGVCGYRGDLSMIENINNADMAMYAAKNAGKNRVVSYDDLEDTKFSEHR